MCTDLIPHCHHLDGAGEVKLAQLASWAWVGSGSFSASALTVGVLTPIQEGQGIPGEAEDRAEYLRVLLAVGLS